VLLSARFPYMRLGRGSALLEDQRERCKDSQCS
jgi:hypothetical protein